MLNDPGFLAGVGDRGVRTIAQAEEYLGSRVLPGYAESGFGMLVVTLAGEPIGLCGLVARPGLPAPDLGYALLGRFCGHGFAFEAAAAMRDQAVERLAIDPLLGVVRPGNARSAALLEKLGFVADGTVTLPGAAEASQLFRLSPSSPRI